MTKLNFWSISPLLLRCETRNGCQNVVYWSIMNAKNCSDGSSNTGLRTGLSDIPKFRFFGDTLVYMGNGHCIYSFFAPLHNLDNEHVRITSKAPFVTLELTWVMLWNVDGWMVGVMMSLSSSVYNFLVVLSFTQNCMVILYILVNLGCWVLMRHVMLQRRELLMPFPSMPLRMTNQKLCLIRKVEPFPISTSCCIQPLKNYPVRFL